MALKCELRESCEAQQQSLSPSTTLHLQVRTKSLTAILLPAAIRNLRNNPQLLFVRLPNILSFLCIVVGVVWLLLLPLNEYSRHTYISENALLPGQVHAYFTGSEQNIFRGYKKELQALIQEGRDNGPQNPEVESTPAYVKQLGEQLELDRVLIIKE